MTYKSPTSSASRAGWLWWSQTHLLLSQGCKICKWKLKACLLLIESLLFYLTVILICGVKPVLQEQQQLHVKNQTISYVLFMEKSCLSMNTPSQSVIICPALANNVPVSSYWKAQVATTMIGYIILTVRWINTNRLY